MDESSSNFHSDSSNRFNSSSSFARGHNGRGSSLAPTSPLPDSDLDDLINKLDHNVRHERPHASSSSNRYSSRSQAATDFNISVNQQLQNDMKRLKQIWIAERTAPEILDFEESLINRMIERIQHQVSVFFFQKE